MKPFLFIFLISAFVFAGIELKVENDCVENVAQHGPEILRGKVVVATPSTDAHCQFADVDSTWFEMPLHKGDHNTFHVCKITKPVSYIYVDLGLFPTLRPVFGTYNVIPPTVLKSIIIKIYNPKEQNFGFTISVEPENPNDQFRLESQAWTVVH